MRTRIAFTALGFAISTIAATGGTMVARAAQPAGRGPAPAIPFLASQTFDAVPAMSDRFVDTVGADSDFADDYAPYVTKFSLVSKQLIASKIRHLRDSNSGTLYDNRMTYLFQHGIRHSIGFTMGESAAFIRATVAANAGQTEFVEGPNEYDLNAKTDPAWATQLRAMQTTLYDTVRAMPAAKSLTVIGPALADPKMFNVLGNVQSIEDAGALHEGSCDYNPGTSHYNSVANWFLNGRISTPTKPIWTTEAGYTTDLTRTCSIPESVAAKYDPRLIAEYFNDGGPRLYFFQLADQPDDPVFGGKGLIDQNGVAKPQFTAVSSLLNVLSDPGANFKTVPLTFTLSGNTAGVAHTLLQRRNGVYELLLWLEVPSWNHDTRQPIAVPPQSVTVTLKGQPAAGQLLSYTTTWGMQAKPVAFSAGSATIAVTDSISVLEFK